MSKAKRTDTTVVLDTRMRNGLKWRRYRTAEGEIFTTYEVPCTVLNTLGRARLQAELQRAARQRERDARNARALALLAEGWKPLAVAAEIGLCEAQVRRLRQKSQPIAPARISQPQGDAR